MVPDNPRVRSRSEIVTDKAAIEAALADTVDPPSEATLPRCDCPALEVPHVHEPGGPVPLPE